MEKEWADTREIASFGEGGVAIGVGLLGATGATFDEAQSNRLLEIERRILALEARPSNGGYNGPSA